MTAGGTAYIRRRIERDTSWAGRFRSPGALTSTVMTPLRERLKGTNPLVVDSVLAGLLTIAGLVSLSARPSGPIPHRATSGPTCSSSSASARWPYGAGTRSPSWPW